MRLRHFFDPRPVSLKTGDAAIVNTCRSAGPAISEPHGQISVKLIRLRAQVPIYGRTASSASGVSFFDRDVSSG
jgi:hypothetical protein